MRGRVMNRCLIGDAAAGAWSAVPACVAWEGIITVRAAKRVRKTTAIEK